MSRRVLKARRVRPPAPSELNGPNLEQRPIFDDYHWRAAIVIRRSSLLLSDWFDGAASSSPAQKYLARRLQLEIAAALRDVAKRKRAL